MKQLKCIPACICAILDVLYDVLDSRLAERVQCLPSLLDTFCLELLECRLRLCLRLEYFLECLLQLMSSIVAFPSAPR